MNYVIGFVVIVFVGWRIYSMVTARKKEIDLTNPNVGRSVRRPDKPNEFNEL